MSRIIQLIPSFAANDAVGNDAVNIYRASIALGYESFICANRVSAVPVDVPYRFDFSPEDFREDDIILYHFSIGDRMTDLFVGLPGKKVLVYHNVTPPGFFEPYDKRLARLCRAGLQQVRSIVGKVDACWADSEWNKRDLVNMGFTCPIDVMPILLSFDDYAAPYDERLLSALKKEQGTKILFVGRIAPNKCQHDVIRAFHCYRERYDSDAQLYLVGGHDDADAYYASLLDYTLKLGPYGIHIMDSVPLPELLAFYRGTDLFLCLSEHEGFCVPLVEASLFDVPIIAYDACAVGETLGPDALVIDTKDPRVIAALVNKVMEDDALRRRLIEAQRERIKLFEHDRLIALLRGYLEEYTEDRS